MKLTVAFLAALSLTLSLASAQRFVKQRRLRRPNQLLASTAMECPNGDIGFELITGFVYSSADDIIESNIGALHMNECVQQCRKSPACKALNFETGLCVLFKTAAGSNSCEYIIVISKIISYLVPCNLRSNHFVKWYTS